MQAETAGISLAYNVLGGMMKITLKKLIKAFIPYGLLYLLRNEKKYTPPISYRPFSRIFDKNFVFLYAGNIPDMVEYKKYDMLGLSLTCSDKRHIRHNITYRHDLPDNFVDVYQAEDVFEHINYDSLKFVVKEIFRLLKPGGLFCLSGPDYNNPEVLKNKFLLKDENGIPIFDPAGGGNYELETGKVIDGGHVWFPVYETVKKLLETVEWSSVNFLQYYDEDKRAICKEIDYSRCYFHRKESMVVYCYK